MHNTITAAFLRSAGLVLLAILSLMSVALARPASAQTSTLCPTLNATVAHGGAVSIDAATCHAGFGLGNIATQATHGVGSVGPFGPSQQINYAHNGVSGTTDSFVVRDGNSPPNNLIRVNITITPPASSIVVSPSSLPALTAGVSFNQSLSSTGGTAPYSYSLESGTLPPGLALGATGVLSGVPSQRGGYTFSVRSQDAVGAVAVKGYTGTVQNPALAITPASATAIQGIPFSQTLSASGGVAPHVYQIESGAFPSGISISSAGVVSGTTNAGVGSYPVTLRVTDSSTGPGSYFELETFTVVVTPPPSVSIAVSPSSVAEDGAANLIYTVTRSVSLPSTTVVNIASSGTATAGTDYSGGVSTISIPAGATSATITINPTPDVANDANETVILTVSPGSGYSVGAPASATGTIAAPESTSAFCTSFSGVVANGGSVSFNVSNCDGPFDAGMSGPVVQPANGTVLIGVNNLNSQFVTYTHNGNSATTDRFVLEDNDLGLVVFNITISAPTSAIVVSPASLGVLRAGSPFNQSLSASGGAAPYTFVLESGALPAGVALSGGVLSGTPTARGGYSFTVRAQDAASAVASKSYSGTTQNPILSLSPSTYTVLQGVPASFALSPTGGVAPYSYLLETGSLPAGLSLSSAGVISGTPTSAGSSSPTLRVTDSSTGPGQYFELETPTIVVTATPPAVSISVSPAAVAEDGATNLVYTVSRSVALASATTVNLGLSGTATSGTDFTGGVGSVVIPGGALSATVTINPTTDALGEPDETVIMTVAAGSGYTVSAPASATGTINNDDLPTASIAVSPAAVLENSGSPLTWTVTLSQAPASAVTVNLTTAGAATSGVDYSGSVSSVVFAAGETTRTVVISPTPDFAIEPDETVTITVAAGSGYAVGAPAAATATITNDDVPAASISVSPGSVQEDGTDTLVFTLTLDAPPLVATTVSVATGGSATAGTDYATPPATVSFAIGATTATLIIDPTADTAVEGDETVSVSIAAGAGYRLGAPSSTTAAILDDDQVDLSIGDVAVTEGNSGVTNAVFTVNLSQPAGPGGVSFDIATADGTAAAGSDYTANSATDVTISAGQSSAAFTVQVLGDTLNEVSEVFFVDISNVVGATVISARGQGTISNDDSVPTLSIDDVAVVEGDSGTRSATFTVTLSAASGRVITTSYTTHSGSADADVDFVATSGVLTFGPGEVSKTIVVVVNGDTAPEFDEVYSVGLSAAANATFARNTGTGQITNDDAPVTVSPGALPQGVAGSPYSQTLSTSGGQGPYSYSITAGGLPPGLGLSPGGLLSGTPTADGSYNVTITATDSSGAPGPYSGSAVYDLVINAATITLPASSLAAGTRGQAYSAALNPATGGVAPYAYAVTGGALPAGLTLSSAGVISGAPTAFGAFSFTVTATDSSTGTGPFSASRSYSLSVTDAAPVAGAVSLSVAYDSADAPVPLNITGGAAASVAVVVPPTGGTATASGAGITYRPNPGFAGVDSFTYSAANAGGTSAPATVTVTVADPVISITPDGPLTGRAGEAFSRTFAFAGGAAPYSAHAVAGLPAGLSLSGSGPNTATISGVPTQAGTFTVTVSGTDSSSGAGPFTRSATFTLTVGSPSLSLSPASTAFTAAWGEAISQTFVAGGGSGAFAYAATGSLPPGVTLDGTSGQLSGSTTSVGVFSFTVTATDAGSSGAGAPFTVSETYSLTITAPVISLAPSTLASATVGSAYSATLSASGGQGPYSFAIVSGALPGGLTLSSSGALTGTPVAGGTFTFTIAGSDASGAPGPYTASQAYVLTVAAPVVTLPATPLAAGTRGQAYSAALNPATGGVAPYAYAVTGGALPAGLTLSSAGVISGAPTVFGSFNFTVTATDSSTGTGPFSASQGYVLEVADSVPVAGPATASMAYNASDVAIGLNLSGGAATSVSVATPPVNGSATAAGTGISYRPNAGFAGQDSFTYTATNASGSSAPATITVTVSPPVLSITASGPLTATVGTPYSQTFAVSGGAAPYADFVVAGLPAGLTVTGSTATSVSVGGTPTAQGSFTVQVSARDDSTGDGPFAVTQAFGLSIAGPSLSLNPAAGAFTAQYGAPFDQSFAAAGGVGPYSYAVSGSLPSGLAFDGGTGAITGAPTQTGSFAFGVTAVDTGSTGAGAPFSIEGRYTLVVDAPIISIAPSDLPAAVAGQAYSAALTATGAVGPYAYAVSGGALPAGMALSGTGVLSGLPTASGTFAFTVTATDSGGQTGTANLTLVVSSAVLTVTPATLPAGVQGRAYSQTFTTVGGVAPYAYSVSAGALPAGLTIDASSGVLSGVPAGSGLFSFTLRVTDSTAGSASVRDIPYSVEVEARPDPASDPQVRGLLQSQVDTTRRFARAQVDNFSRRLESLRDGAGQGGVDLALSLSGRSECQGLMVELEQPMCEGAARYEDNVPVGAGPGPGTGPGRSQEGAQPWTLWAGGAIRYGDLDAEGGAASRSFETEGVSVGVDRWFSPNFAAGVGVGFGKDDTEIGAVGSRSEAGSSTLAAYATYRTAGGLYVDWLAGYQVLDFDLTRYVTATDGLVLAERSGEQWFASVAFGADLDRGFWRITPYARWDGTFARLDEYSEATGSLHDLRFLAQDADFSSLTAGARIRYSHLARWGSFLPHLRLEYQRDLEQASAAGVGYLDQPLSGFSIVPVHGSGRDMFMLGLGAEILFGDTWAFQFEYARRSASGSGSDQGVQLDLKRRF